MVYARYIYLVYFSNMQSSPICLVYTYFTTHGFVPYLFISRPNPQSGQQRGAPQAMGTDPQPGRKNGEEVYDKSSPSRATMTYPRAEGCKASRGAGQASLEKRLHLACTARCRKTRRSGKREWHRNAQKAKAQAQGQKPDGVILGVDTLSRRLSKRRNLESTRPMYLSQANVLEMDHDLLVGKILMRMTPWQFETRSPRNVVHFVLSEQQRSNPL